MSTFSGVFMRGYLKSIQRGRANVPVGNVNIAISAVNTARSLLTYLGHYHGGGSTFDDIGCHVALQSSTVIRAERGGSSGVISVSWELAEYH